MNVFYLIIFFLGLTFVVFGQGDIDTQKKALIRNERTFYGMLSSNGWGGGFTFSKNKTAFKKNMWNAELSYIKAAKEIKISNPNYPDARRFVFGKSNQFYNIRLGFGKQHQLFGKRDVGGIEIRWYYQLGPTIALLKPVYYEIRDGDDVRIEKFDRSNHLTYQDIYGGASYFTGFSELGVMPGGYCRIASSFEFSKKDLIVNALEGGLTFDLFPKVVEIMANDRNQFFHFSFFISYRFGQIINPRTKNINANNKEN